MAVPCLRVVNERPAMHVTEKLRALRTRAGLSRDAVAERLGFANGSSYQRYETPERFRKENLPLDLTLKLAAIFSEHGIPQAETMALAGLPPTVAVSLTADTPPSVNPKETEGAASLLPEEKRVSIARVQITVQAMAEVLAESDIAMSAADQAEAVALFLAWYEDEVELGRQPAELSLSSAKSLLVFLQRTAGR